MRCVTPVWAAVTGRVTWGDMTLRDRSILCVLLGQLGPWQSRAVADDTETIIIIDRAPDAAARDRERALGDAPFVTVLHPDDRPAAEIGRAHV